MNKLKQYQQVYLFEVPDRDSELTCWLPVDSRVKVGAKLTLKELPGITWQVGVVYATVVDAAHLNRRWRVGGLT